MNCDKAQQFLEEDFLSQNSLKYSDELRIHLMTCTACVAFRERLNAVAQVFVRDDKTALPQQLVTQVRAEWLKKPILSAARIKQISFYVLSGFLIAASSFFAIKLLSQSPVKDKFSTKQKSNDSKDKNDMGVDLENVELSQVTTDKNNTDKLNFKYQKKNDVSLPSTTNAEKVKTSDKKKVGQIEDEPSAFEQISEKLKKKLEGEVKTKPVIDEELTAADENKEKTDKHHVTSNLDSDQDNLMDKNQKNENNLEKVDESNSAHEKDSQQVSASDTKDKLVDLIDAHENQKKISKNDFQLTNKQDLQVVKNDISSETQTDVDQDKVDFVNADENKDQINVTGLKESNNKKVTDQNIVSSIQVANSQDCALTEEVNDYEGKFLSQTTAEKNIDITGQNHAAQDALIFFTKNSPVQLTGVSRSATVRILPPSMLAQLLRGVVDDPVMQRVFLGVEKSANEKRNSDFELQQSNENVIHEKLDDWESIDKVLEELDKKSDEVHQDVSNIVTSEENNVTQDTKEIVYDEISTVDEKYSLNYCPVR